MGVSGRLSLKDDTESFAPYRLSHKDSFEGFAPGRPATTPKFCGWGGWTACNHRVMFVLYRGAMRAHRLGAHLKGCVVAGLESETLETKGERLI